MSKRMYIIPETETAPLHLSACIMSGGVNPGTPGQSDEANPTGAFEAPRKRVF